MALANNLTLVTVTHADVCTRQPVLARLVPASQDDWAPQIAKGIEDALAWHHSATQQLPERCVPTRLGDWKRCCEYFALAAIFESLGEAYEDRRLFFASQAQEMTEKLAVLYDENDDGTITAETDDEASLSIREIRILR